MTAPALEHTYRYLHASALAPTPARPLVALATSGGVAEHPRFFSGVLVRSRQAADVLLALGLVARSRFHMPPAMLERVLAWADPVVTGDGERLRLEAFSACGGVYARADLLPEALDGDWCGRGTTNVDFGPALRAALAGVGEGAPLGLAVGRSEVEVSTAAGTVVERKVALPLRWLRGFLEVQAYAARMQPRLEVDALEARRFLRALPRQRTRGPSWVSPAGRGVRLAQRQAAGAVQVGGLERLRVLDGLERHVRKLRVWQEEQGEASGWEVELDGARLTLLLSAEIWRGFSGEGQALTTLAGSTADSVPAVRAALRWQGSVDEAALADSTGVAPVDVHAALARLGARGLVGFDLADGRYFHRELPFDLGLVEELQPRLTAARALAARVRVLGRGEDELVAEVPGSGVDHRVRLGVDGARCTCAWFARHQGRRGPCKHVLAVQLATSGEEEP